MYPDAKLEASGDEDENDDQKDDLEASIAKEVAAIKEGKKNKIFANIPMNLDCGMHAHAIRNSDYWVSAQCLTLHCSYLHPNKGTGGTRTVCPSHPDGYEETSSEEDSLYITIASG